MSRKKLFVAMAVLLLAGMSLISGQATRQINISGRWDMSYTLSNGTEEHTGIIVFTQTAGNLTVKAEGSTAAGTGTIKGMTIEWSMNVHITSPRNATYVLTYKGTVENYQSMKGTCTSTATPNDPPQPWKAAKK